MFFFFCLDDFFSLSLKSFPDDSCCQDYSFIGKKTCVGWKFMRKFWSFSIQQLPMVCGVLIEKRGAVSFKKMTEEP